MIEQSQAKAHYVYVVHCANGALYTGYTTDIARRVAAHNAGRGGRYTRAHRPVELVAFWRFETKREALQTEYRIKQLPRPQKIALVMGGEESS